MFQISMSKYFCRKRLPQIALAALALCLFCVDVPGQALAQVREFEGAPDLAGFRGVPWGAGASAFSGFVKIKADRTIQRYQKQNENLYIGDAKINSIIYNFYKGRFIGVSIQARGAANWAKIKKTAFANFGPAENISRVAGTEHYEWRGSRAVTSLQFFPVRGNVKLWIESTEIPGLKRPN